ncbi:MAG: antibiotic biosynthesis monooxygenase [Desulfobulbaceae bacterium]|nr:antibiotic biosynthesis monooxygenase [Desulfobulbaceae bacterium]
MIMVIIHMKVSNKNSKELSQTITSLLNCIRTAKGCARCDFFYGLEDENVLCLLEEWDSQINLEKHRNSDCFKVLRGAMNLLEEPCEIISCRSFQPAGELQYNCLEILKNDQL